MCPLSSMKSFFYFENFHCFCLRGWESKSTLKLCDNRYGALAVISFASVAEFHKLKRDISHEDFPNQINQFASHRTFPNLESNRHLTSLLSSSRWHGIVILVRFGLRFSCPLNLSSVCQDKNSLGFPLLTHLILPQSFSSQIQELSM